MSGRGTGGDSATSREQTEPPAPTPFWQFAFGIQSIGGRKMAKTTTKKTKQNKNPNKTNKQNKTTTKNKNKKQPKTQTKTFSWQRF